MKKRIHAMAGAIAMLTIFSFWTSTLYVELFGSEADILWVKEHILKGMFVLIPAMIMVGGSGVALAGKRQGEILSRKKKRMPFVAANGLLILLPAAFYLAGKARAGEFDGLFYAVQMLELIAGATNLTLLGLNMRDGLRLSGKGKSRGAPGLRIRVLEDGPLMVEGLTEVTLAEGQSLELPARAALCRCGASQTKPFCDGSHTAAGFSGARSGNATPDGLMEFEGPEITVVYNRLLCSKAAVCGDKLKVVFDSSRKPWIQPDLADREAILDVVKACPSGALSYRLPGKPRCHAMNEQAKIAIEANGPYWVTGVELADTAWAEGACEQKYVLCRCGASKNKPFCDGAHKAAGFKG